MRSSAFPRGEESRRERPHRRRLKAVLPTLLPALEQHGHLSLDPAVREQLLTVSAATID